MKLNPGEYMQTYTPIVRMCDEQDKAADLYIIYKEKLAKYINQNIT